MERRIECLERVVREQQEEMERLKGALSRSKSPIMTAAKANRANNSFSYAPAYATQQLNVDGPFQQRTMNGNLTVNTTPINIRSHVVAGDNMSKVRKQLMNSTNPGGCVRPKIRFSQSGSINPNGIQKDNVPRSIATVPNPSMEEKRRIDSIKSSGAVSIINKRKNAVEDTKTFTRTLPPKQIVSNKPDLGNKHYRGGVKQLRALKAVRIYVNIYLLSNHF